VTAFVLLEIYIYQSERFCHFGSIPLLNSTTSSPEDGFSLDEPFTALCFIGNHKIKSYGLIDTGVTVGDFVDGRTA